MIVNLGARDLIAAVAVGIGASLCMDLWNLFLKRAFGLPSLNYCMLGRWIGHMPRGVFRHENIATAPRTRFECATGWIAHYTIGILLAVTFVALAPQGWLAQPTFLPALGFGIVTVAFPFFVLQPALGLGIASARSPKRAQARLKSLATHTVFGVGLYVCALVASHLLRVGS